MNVLQNLIALYNRLEPESTYRNVCRGILTNMDKVANATIYEIADMTDSSRTTIWRMVQKMGYENFTDFHHDLKNAVNRYAHYNRIIPAETILEDEDIKNVLSKQALAAHKIVKQYIKTEDLLTTARMVSRADKVSMYIPYHTASLTSFQQNLAISGVETNYFDLIPDMLTDCKKLTNKSLVLIKTIDFAETMDMEVIFEMIKSSGAQIWTVLSTRSRYTKYVDKVLIPYEESREIVTETLISDIYFFMLSEIYRRNVIDK